MKALVAEKHAVTIQHLLEGLSLGKVRKSLGELEEQPKSKSDTGLDRERLQSGGWNKGEDCNPWHHVA